jgi:hypothetical protein
MQVPPGLALANLVQVLTDLQVQEFVESGCVAVRGAFPRSMADACLDVMWPDTGCDRHDPSTWDRPVVRLDGYGEPPFREAANQSGLIEAFDQLVGAGRWTPRTGLGTIPVRFPSAEDPGDSGWHIESSFSGADGEPRVNVASRGRGLLMLFLFTDVGQDDAPTRVRLGSHLDVPGELAPYGDEGLPWMAACRLAVPASRHRPVAVASGAAGDVWLCHPFLVHAAQPHRGSRPRFMAQPELALNGALDLTGRDPSPVERAVHKGLHRLR